MTEDTMSPEYRDALEASHRASREFGEVQTAYRNRTIGDAEFLTAHAKFHAAKDAFDVASEAEERRIIAERRRVNAARRVARRSKGEPVTNCRPNCEWPQECGRMEHGSVRLCPTCAPIFDARYPQGWRAYPGDTCKHGVYVGGCGVDHMCGLCEAGES